MRTVTVNVYKFSDLSDKAKKVARDWWRECESSDPAWVGEHKESAQAAIDHRHDATALADSLACKWTGYTDDAILADNWDGTGEVPSARTIRDWYSAAWDKEVEHNMSDEAVDENIEINEYEFDESGKLWTGE